MWQASLFKTIYLTSRTLSRKISPSLLLNVAWEVNTAMRSLIYTLCRSRYNLHWLLSNNINKIHHTIVTQCTKQTSPDNTVTDVKRQIMHSVGCLFMKVVPDALIPIVLFFTENIPFKERYNGLHKLSNEDMTIETNP